MSVPDDIVRDGLNAFWATVAAWYPEVTPGDRDPKADSALKDAARTAVDAWMRDNL